MKKILLILLASCLLITPSRFQLCGQTSFSAGLIVKGDEVKRGEFPFLVALLRLSDQKFFCGANLITQKHALTGKTSYFQCEGLIYKHFLFVYAYSEPLHTRQVSHKSTAARRYYREIGKIQSQEHLRAGSCRDGNQQNLNPRGLEVLCDAI
jgi:hypothetical protein